MKPETFFDNFEMLADAPNGVQKLRELILQLAVRGKLVPQDANDESAEVLLKKIKAEKERLTKEREIKTTESLSPAKTEEMIYDLPKSWKWSRFSEICSYIQRGKSPDYVEKSNFPVISQKCVQWEGLKIENARFINPSSIEKYDEERFLRTGDILWNSTGTGTVGRAVVYVHKSDLYEKVVVDSHVTIVRPMKVNPKFFYLWIASPSVQNEIENLTSGSTKQVELATSTIRNQIIPVPPLEEQRRIVAKVDQLISLCDKLEVRQQKKRESRAHLNGAALDRLLAARAPGEFAEGWGRIYDNFYLLYDAPENIEKLREIILQFAFQGKLTQQLTTDENVNELLMQIKKHKGFENGKNNKTKINPKIDLPNGIFEVPISWGWSYLELICDQIGDIDHKMPKAVDIGIPFISAKDLKDNGTLDFSDPKFISEEDYERLSRKIKPTRGDIIYSRIGARLGKARLVEVDDKFLISYSCCLIRPLHQYIYKKYLQLFLDSHLALNQAYLGTQSIGVPDLGMGVIKKYKIPIPPREEQRRIVARVDQLMSLCDELEAGLARSQADSEKLMEAVVSHLLAG
jgi:type I restriction enzyme S subunit